MMGMGMGIGDTGIEGGQIVFFGLEESDWENAF